MDECTSSVKYINKKVSQHAENLVLFIINDEDNTSQTNFDWNVCLYIRVNVKTDQVEGEDAAKVAPNHLDLVDRHERRSQVNIELPLEVNLWIDVEPKIVLLIPSWVEN